MDKNSHFQNEHHKWQQKPYCYDILRYLDVYKRQSLFCQTAIHTNRKLYCRFIHLIYNINRRCV